jgi:hypothetical protein
MGEILIGMRLWIASVIVGKHSIIQNVDISFGDYLIFIDHGKRLRSKNIKICDGRSMIRYTQKPSTEVDFTI